MNKKHFAIILICTVFSINSAYAVIDDPIVGFLNDKDIEKPLTHTDYNYQSTVKIPVKLSLTEPIDSETDVYDGQKVTFRVINTVYYKGDILVKRGAIVPARVETTISSGMNGIPAYIIFGGFELENIPNGKITDTVEASGLDRSLWVFPLKWALTPLPPTGSLTNFIKGGHAKVHVNDTFVIYYHPDWK